MAIDTLGTNSLGANSVTSAKIADGTIATADIADNAVTNAKFGGTGAVAYFVNSSGTAISGETNYYYPVTAPGEYSIHATSKTTGCTAVQGYTVSENPSPSM